MNINNNIKTAWLISFKVNDNETYYLTTAPFKITYPTIGGSLYTPSPLITTIGRVADTLKMSETTTSITFSMVDISVKQFFLNTSLNGRVLTLRRIIFNDDWSYNDSNVILRYSGIINSISFNNDYSEGNSDSTFTASVLLKGIKEILTSRIAGRFTEKNSMRRFFPSDTAFDYIPQERDRIIILGKT